MDPHAQEVAPSTGICCENTRTLDHFCGNGSLLAKKRSRCINCDKEVPSEVWKSNDSPPRIYMRKYCPECGVTSARLSSDAQFYFLQNEGSACGCGPTGCSPVVLGDNAKTTSQLHTCTLVVEIVRDCNLACPTCYANSPKAPGAHTTDFLPFDEFTKQILAVLEKQGKVDIVQLSGGEPTLHPEFMRIIAWLRDEPRVLDVLLNTNGVRLLDPLFMDALARTIPKGRFGIYMQYDGVSESGQVALRGGDMRTGRERAIAQCAKHGITVALVMTVAHDNKFDCAQVLDRALMDDHIRWVVYQPEFLSGRNNPEKRLEVPLNVADIIHSVARDGVMDIDSWMPLPCSDPNCGMVGFLVRQNGTWLPVSKYIDMQQFAPLIVNRMNFDTDDSLSTCGCDNFSLAEYLEQIGVAQTDIKMVFIKPFMDVRTWDTARIASCCTHVLTPDGHMDSFCRYYGSK